MSVVVSKELLLTAYAYLFFLEEARMKQTGHALQMQIDNCLLASKQKRIIAKTEHFYAKTKETQKRLTKANRELSKAEAAYKAPQSQAPAKRRPSRVKSESRQVVTRKSLARPKTAARVEERPLVDEQSLRSGSGRPPTLLDAERPQPRGKKAPYSKVLLKIGGNDQVAQQKKPEQRQEPRIVEVKPKLRRFN